MASSLRSGKKRRPETDSDAEDEMGKEPFTLLVLKSFNILDISSLCSSVHKIDYIILHSSFFIGFSVKKLLSSSKAKS